MFTAYASLFFNSIALLSWSATLAIASLAGNNTDLLALLAIKSRITQDPQRVLDTWNSSLHFCQWQGVTCGRRHPRVTMLDLGSRGLVGSLSPYIGNLSFLREIWVQNNSFNGVIPPQLGGLFRLQMLILNNNTFEGGIPSSMANLTSLETISAVYNHLGGIIPNVFGQLNNLKEIGFGVNQLHGMIPPSLYNLTSLTVVSFPNNQINGGLPKDIGLQLPNLEIFQVWGNNLTGTIPFSFSNCSNLLELSLGNNSFTGKVDINFRGIPNLRYFGLYNNTLGGWEPDGMKFIDSMINCSNLEMLLLSWNQFRGVLHSSIGNLSSQLTTLTLDNNFIYGTLPSWIGNLVKLEVLSLSSNQLTGILPNELGNLQSVVKLLLNYNNFTGNLPNFLGNLSSLNELDLSNNRLQGQIPPSVGKSKSLTLLELSTNNLSGVIPKEIFQLSSLIYLNLSKNHLGGPLPQEIGNLKSLMNLDLSQNDLVGEIPDAITGCLSLEYIYLKANSFDGPIPPAFKELRGIRDLDLSSNNFSGKIPIFLEQLNFSTLDLSFNNLDGEVPIKGVFANASTIAINGNGRLCGGIPELGLPRCHTAARSKKGSRLILVFVSLFSSVVVLALALFLLFCWQRMKRQAQQIEASSCQPFSMVSYGSIHKATHGFSERNLIGTGSFSVVYKGILEADGAMVAIKVLKLENQGAFKTFMAECEALKNIRHRNLVKIITSCSSLDYQGNNFKALVYEFMPNGNLDRWLHLSQEHQIEYEEAAPRRLSLRQRVTIALDVAHAIHYLHEECEIPIIHCDLKPSNILLDSDMVAHIGDFGLAKFLPLKPHESSSIGIRGTIGYAAPEYGLGSEMTKEGDIYSFGILLLEMMTGKRPTDEDFKDGLNLRDYVKMALPDHAMQIVDPVIMHDLEEEMEAANANCGSGEDEARKWKRLEDGIISLCRIGLACSKESPRERMDTSKILHELHRINASTVASI